MTLMRGLLGRSNPLNDPSRPLTDATLLSLLNGWSSATGRSVSPEGALRVGAALRGMWIIASAVGGLPFKAYRRSDRSEALGSVLSTDTLMTSYERWSTVVAHMVSYGDGYIWKVRNPAGMVTGLVPVHPSRVKVDVEDASEVGVAYTKRFTIDRHRIASNYEISHVWALSLDSVHGIGPIGHAREAYALALSAEEAAARLYGGGMMLSGVLSTDQALNKEQADTIKDRWKAKLSGVANAHDVAVLDRNLKFQQLSMSPADAQFLEARKFQVSEIARLLGLPGWMLNDQEKSTSWGTGMEQQFSTFVMLTLRSYLQPIEQRITLDLLPRTQYAEFTVEGLLRGDSAARAAYYASGIQHGWLVPNDVRPKENLPTVPWGDEPYLPFNQSANQGGNDAGNNG